MVLPAETVTPQPADGSAQKPLPDDTTFEAQTVKRLDLFKPKWRHSDARERLKAVLNITRRKTLRKIAATSEDECLRYQAACRLNDTFLIRQLASSASRESVRLAAGIRANAQPSLVSIALNAWDIEVGKTAVKHIDNDLLLQRVARSAKQDAIRLAAALKLGDEALLRRVARSSGHIHVHWQVARHLDDPCLLAEVSLFSPANPRLETIRQKARIALRDYLVRCWLNDDHSGLMSAMLSVPHPVFKIEAFVRLPADRVTARVANHLSMQDFRYIPRDLLDRMICHIKSAGWTVSRSIGKTPCGSCRGNGELHAKYVTSNNTWMDHDSFPCPDCDGHGKVPEQMLVCCKTDDTITFKLPA